MQITKTLPRFSSAHWIEIKILNVANKPFLSVRPMLSTTSSCFIQLPSHSVHYSPIISMVFRISWICILSTYIITAKVPPHSKFYSFYKSEFNYFFFRQPFSDYNFYPWKILDYIKKKTNFMTSGVARAFMMPVWISKKQEGTYTISQTFLPRTLASVSESVPLRKH